MHRARRFTFLAAVLILAAAISASPASVSAQSRGSDAPPYEPDLMRLSEIMGALHFLRPLCGETDDPDWRSRMETLLVVETRDENRRRRFIERFNQGYRGFSAIYRNCTSSASTAMGQYILEGEAIIRRVSSRYGR